MFLIKGLGYGIGGYGGYNGYNNGALYNNYNNHGGIILKNNKNTNY